MPDLPASHTGRRQALGGILVASHTLGISSRPRSGQQGPDLAAAMATASAGDAPFAMGYDAHTAPCVVVYVTVSGSDDSGARRVPLRSLRTGRPPADQRVGLEQQALRRACNPYMHARPSAAAPRSMRGRTDPSSWGRTPPAGDGPLQQGCSALRSNLCRASHARPLTSSASVFPLPFSTIFWTLLFSGLYYFPSIFPVVPRRAFAARPRARCEVRRRLLLCMQWTTSPPCWWRAAWPPA